MVLPSALIVSPALHTDTVSSLLRSDPSLFSFQDDVSLANFTPTHSALVLTTGG